jgi:hypothetical protein
MTEEEQFFSGLLDKTRMVYETSPVYKKHGANKNWHYAICDTPIVKGKGVFFGLNWGGKDHKAQTVHPTEDYIRDWPLAKHANHYLDKHFDIGLSQLNYSNLCFFRTPTAKYLSYQDWQLSIPLFQEYVEYISPPWAIMLGSPEILSESQFTQRKRFEFKAANVKRRSFAYVGLLFGKYPFGAVPHSSARCSPETHSNLWSQMEVELKNIISDKK